MPEKKHRKSVAFSEGATVMDANGEITEASHATKSTAEKHTASKLLRILLYLPCCGTRTDLV